MWFNKEAYKVEQRRMVPATSPIVALFRRPPIQGGANEIAVNPSNGALPVYKNSAADCFIPSPTLRVHGNEDESKETKTHYRKQRTHFKRFRGNGKCIEDLGIISLQMGGEGNVKVKKQKTITENREPISNNSGEMGN
ncbi:hypothetical protein U1Q18_028195, partial [Sarracenia purpurea var. burkii]